MAVNPRRSKLGIFAPEALLEDQPRRQANRVRARIGAGALAFDEGR